MNDSSKSLISIPNLLREFVIWTMFSRGISLVDCLMNVKINRPPPCGFSCLVSPRPRRHNDLISSLTCSAVLRVFLVIALQGTIGPGYKRIFFEICGMEDWYVEEHPLVCIQIDISYAASGILQGRLISLCCASSRSIWFHHLRIWLKRF